MAVNLKEISNTLPILDYEVSDEPLWASDTGRNSNSGKYSGTFIGYFPQLKISFGETTQAQMTSICNYFEKSVVSITYVNKNTGSERTADFYGTAISGKLNYWDGKYQGFELTLTAISKKG